MPYRYYLKCPTCSAAPGEPCTSTTLRTVAAITTLSSLPLVLPGRVRKRKTTHEGRPYNIPPETPLYDRCGKYHVDEDNPNYELPCAKPKFHSGPHDKR